MFKLYHFYSESLFIFTNVFFCKDALQQWPWLVLKCYAFMNFIKETLLEKTLN